MFSVTKALKKLNFLLNLETSPGACRNGGHPVSFKELTEILLAGQSEEVDTSSLATIITWHRNLEHKIDGIEERLARLERNARCCDNGLFGEEHDCQKKEPSKPTECEHDFRDYIHKSKTCIKCGEEGITIGKPEKPVTEQDCQDDHDQPHKLFKDDKPSECEHEWWFRGLKIDHITCKFCGCVRMISKHQPDDYIRISRKVAEEFLKHSWTYKAGTSMNNMMREIKKALEEK